MEINRNTIIKDLIESHPETLAVFKKYNLVIAGGVRGPNEPIAFFAKHTRLIMTPLLRSSTRLLKRAVVSMLKFQSLKKTRFMKSL